MTLALRASLPCTYISNLFMVSPVLLTCIGDNLHGRTRWTVGVIFRSNSTPETAHCPHPFLRAGMHDMLIMRCSLLKQTFSTLFLSTGRQPKTNGKKLSTLN